ncbi:MAG: hypothetical protein K8T25_00025 [Planctomycetia bacterium]|nr:hypothetical protein [Planctomycetia bacterium]
MIEKPASLLVSFAGLAVIGLALTISGCSRSGKPTSEQLAASAAAHMDGRVMSSPRITDEMFKDLEATHRYRLDWQSDPPVLTVDESFAGLRKNVPGEADNVLALAYLTVSARRPSWPARWADPLEVRDSGGADIMSFHLSPPGTSAQK